MTTQSLTPEEQQILLKLARETIGRALQGDPEPPPVPEPLTSRLQEPGAAFVTLTLGGTLRGCIGSLVARRPLVIDVRENALAAAFEDPRFPPLTLSEFPRLHIEISVLTAPQPLSYDGPDDLLRKLRPEVDGVIIERGWQRATFLPQVWEQLPNPVEFLEHLCYKAGLPINAWRWPDLKVSTYQVEKFEEAAV